MEHKPILKKLLVIADQEERSYLVSLDEATGKQCGTLKEWAPKDVLAHIAFWKQHHADNLAALKSGGTAKQLPDWQHTNDDVFTRYESETLENIAGILAEANKSMHASLAALDEADLASDMFLPREEPAPLWRTVVGNTYTHAVWHLADLYLKQGDRVAATRLHEQIFDELAPLDDSPDWQGTLQYNMACHYALMGQTQTAIENLSAALAKNPGLLEWSKEDPDFESLRQEPGYQALYA